MNNSSFVRKIAYIAIIACLLIPLSLVSRPATRNADTNELISGGQLARLRDAHNLSQSKLAEIDPASETMKLASLGLRGVAVNMLWMQAIEHKKKERWDQLESTLNALVKIQPNFIKVWEFQAHNMSYNISMEFDDYEYRYHWVKKGIKFLTKGLGPNYRDHRMTDNLGFFTGMKIGISDERRQFRRMFRSDTDFRSEMSEFIEPEDYQTRYGHDNWKMAYQWYNRSRNLVEVQSAKPHSSDIMFYMRRPAQLRNLAGAQQEEFRSDEAIREIWASAYREWMEYGEQPLGNTLGQVISLESLVKTNEELERKRAELDKLAPEGSRQEIMASLQDLIDISEAEQAALDTPTDQRTDEQEVLARNASTRQHMQEARVDMMVAQRVPGEEQLKARRIGDDIAALMADLRTIDRYQGTINYRYWRIRTKAEMAEQAIRARQLLFDAEELARRSIFDDEYEVDPKTGEIKITQEGAITTYEKSYQMFAQVLEEFPALMQGELADDLVESLMRYVDMLELTGLDWPENFPLQKFVDYQVVEEGESGLPSTEELRQRRLEEGLEDVETDDESIESETVDPGTESDDTSDNDSNDPNSKDEDDPAEGQGNSSDDDNSNENQEDN